MIRLTFVDAPQLLGPILADGLQSIQEKRGEPWTPAFVMGALEAGNAALFRIHDDGEHIAYMVVERMEQGGAPWINVWCLWGGPLERHEEIVPLIDKLALDVGCDRWRCTGRRGWEKIGLRPVATVFERKLT